MNKLFSVLCLSAYMAIIGHIFIMFYKLSGAKESKDLESKLNEEQLKIYNFIKKERKEQYMYGLLIGIVLSIIYRFTIGRKENVMLCVYIGITTFIANHFYLLMPKTYWMIEHLEEKEDILAWNKVYRRMRYLTSYSDLVGIIFFVIGNFM